MPTDDWRDDEARRAIDQRLDDILAAVGAADTDRPKSFLLDSPKFSTFSDEPRFERQDYAAAMEYEATEFPRSTRSGAPSRTSGPSCSASSRSSPPSTTTGPWRGASS